MQDRSRGYTERLRESMQLAETSWVDVVELLQQMVEATSDPAFSGELRVERFNTPVVPVTTMILTRPDGVVVTIEVRVTGPDVEY